MVGIEFAVRRGYLLIGRQLDFRVAYRRGTHHGSVASASPLVKSTTRPRYEINTSSTALPRGDQPASKSPFSSEIIPDIPYPNTKFPYLSFENTS